MPITEVPPLAGEPELKLCLTPAMLEAFEAFVGVTPADFISLADAGRTDPKQTVAVLMAALVGGGMPAKEARGTVDRLTRQTAMPTSYLAMLAVRDSMAQ